MKYRFSPFNILCGMFIGVIIWYFMHAIMETNFDRHGWSAVFTLMPSIFLAIIFFIGDFVIQRLFKTKKYQWVIILEGSIIVIM
jgi:uncharacterized membrane protein